MQSSIANCCATATNKLPVELRKDKLVAVVRNGGKLALLRLQLVAQLYDAILSNKSSVCYTVSHDMSEDDVDAVCDELHSLGFDPSIFRLRKSGEQNVSDHITFYL